MKIKNILLAILTVTSFNTHAQETVYFCGNSNPNGFYEVWKQVTSTSSGSSYSKMTNNLGFNYWWVEPSPDNTKLLLMRTPAVAGINDQFNYDSCQMVVMDLSSSIETVIVDYEQYGWSAFGNPHWHPSGNRIILLAQPTNEFFLFTINTDGTNPQQLSTQFTLDPHWSNSGDKITFVGINSTPTFPASFDDFEIFTADYDYTSNTILNLVQLTNDTLRDHDPCFSMDDSQIAFSSGSQNLSFANIVRIDANGTNRTNLVSDNTTNGGPVNWGSNNKIYYHNVHLFVTGFSARSFDVATNTVSNIAQSTGKSISPYYKNVSLASTKELNEVFDQLLVYPNPIIDNVLTIELNSQKDRGQLTLFNLEGKIVFEAPIFNLVTSLDVANLKGGAYLLQLKTDGGVVNRKIIKGL